VIHRDVGGLSVEIGHGVASSLQDVDNQRVSLGNGFGWFIDEMALLLQPLLDKAPPFLSRQIPDREFLDSFFPSGQFRLRLRAIPRILNDVIVFWTKIWTEAAYDFARGPRAI